MAKMKANTSAGLNYWRLTSNLPCLISLMSSTPFTRLSRSCSWEITMVITWRAAGPSYFRRRPSRNISEVPSGVLNS